MRKLVPLKSIYAFVAVAESGSMTEAAQLLSVSHSAISQAIKSLESQVNKPLFDRIGRHVYLNTEGKKILPQSRASVRTNRRCNRSTDARSELSTHYAKHGEFLGTALVDPTYATLQAYAPQLDVRLSTFLDGSIWNKKALMLRWCMATLKSGKTTIAKSSVKTNWY